MSTERLFEPITIDLPSATNIVVACLNANSSHELHENALITRFVQSLPHLTGSAEALLLSKYRTLVLDHHLFHEKVLLHSASSLANTFNDFKNALQSLPSENEILNMIIQNHNSFLASRLAQHEFLKPEERDISNWTLTLKVAENAER